MSRTVTLVLAGPDGVPVGQLPPFEVATPWWQEVDDVVAGARDAYGVDAVVLRLLDTERAAAHGGAVTYLATYAGPRPPVLRPVSPELARLATVDEPRRAPYARPGGPEASLAWAAGRLGGPILRVDQRRTWNLSSIWRLSTPDGTVWLKEVPPFFTHEPAVLRWLGDARPGLAPGLLASDGTRMLMAHVPGEDAYDAPAPVALGALADLLALQADAVAQTDRLIAAGVPALRTGRLAARLAGVVERYADTVEPDDRRALGRLVDTLDSRFAAVAAAGVPDTLVHGDFHPGNLRVDGPRRVILDWGDSSVGHPGFDLMRMVGMVPGAEAELGALWSERWRAAVLGCEPERAVELLAPIGDLHAAAVYAVFLENIEPVERRFHVNDVPDCLRRAAAGARAHLPQVET